MEPNAASFVVWSYWVGPEILTLRSSPAQLDEAPLIYPCVSTCLWLYVIPKTSRETTRRLPRDCSRYYDHGVNSHYLLAAVHIHVNLLHQISHRIHFLHGLFYSNSHLYHTIHTSLVVHCSLTSNFFQHLPSHSGFLKKLWLRFCGYDV